MVARMKSEKLKSKMVRGSPETGDAVGTSVVFSSLGHSPAWRR